MKTKPATTSSMNAEGYLTIRGRKKEMVIVSGFNVYPREIEEVLFRHPDISEAAVIGVPDTYRGESLLAYVVTTRADLTGQDLQEYLGQYLVKYKWPARIVPVSELPKTSVGKVDKNALRMMSTGDAHGTAAFTTV